MYWCVIPTIVNDYPFLLQFIISWFYWYKPFGGDGILIWWIEGLMHKKWNVYYNNNLWDDGKNKDHLRIQKKWNQIPNSFKPNFKLRMIKNGISFNGVNVWLCGEVMKLNMLDSKMTYFSCIESGD